MKITKLIIFLSCVLVLGAFASGCGSGYLSESFSGAGTSGTDGEGSFEQDGPATVMSIDGVYPLDGSSGVVLGTRVSVTFSNALLASSLAGNVSVGLVGPVTSISAPTKSMSGMLSKSTDVPGSPSLEEDGKTVTFTASDNYEDCSVFGITVTGGDDGVQAADGSHLAEDHTSQFMSACPAMLNVDVAGGWDMGFSGSIDGDNLYVGAGAYAASGYSYSTVYKPLVDKIDASTGLGNSVWGGPYLPANGLQAVPDLPTAIDIIVTDEFVATAGYERGLFDNMSYSAHGWLQVLDPATGDSLGGDDGMQAPVLPPALEMYCNGMAQSPTTGDIILTCHSSDATTPIGSNIWSIDVEGGGLSGLGDHNMGNNQGYHRGAFDSSGNFYVTLGTYLYYWDLSYQTFLSLDVFEASQLENMTIPPPTAFATYAEAYSNGSDVAIAMENGSPIFYVTGYTDSTQGGTVPDVDALLVKFDAQGNTLWSVKYDGLDIGGTDTFNAVAVDDDGNVYITGFRARELLPGPFASIWKYDMVLAKYSSSGEQQFLVAYTMGDHGSDDNSMGNDVLLNADGEIFVVGGVYNGPGEGDNIAVWRFDNDGNSGGVF